MKYKYNIRTGAKKIKTKTGLVISGATLGFAGLIMAVAIPFGARAATTCNVSTPAYPTIQSAVNDSSCDIVNVNAGAYPENVTINRAVVLNGAQAGVDARTRSGAESVINGGVASSITITADNVTVDGFTLNGPASSGTADLVMQNGNMGETIQNNIFNNPGRAASITTSDTIFQKNRVNNTATSSDGFQANTSPVHDLNLSNNNFNGADSTIYNADITIIEGNSNVTVSGNTSNHDGTLVALFKTNGGTISNNTVVGTADSSAIYIGGLDNNISVTGNNVSLAATAVKVSNAFGVGLNSTVTIIGNILQNNENGVDVATNSEDGTVTATRNSITGNTVFGISNEPISGTTRPLDGTCNWWGAANGPGPVGTGTGDRVSTGVTFAPWLVSSNLNGACIGGNIASNKNQCKDNGWMTLTRKDGSTFKNQGDCVSYTNIGR